jgi:hypothetical protein
MICVEEDDVVDVVIVGAVDAVAAGTTAGSAGVVNAVAVAAAAVDRSHDASRDRELSKAREAMPQQQA